MNRHLLEAILAAVVVIGCLGAAGMQKEQMNDKLASGRRRDKAAAAGYRGSATVFRALAGAAAVTCVFELARWVL